MRVKSITMLTLVYACLLGIALNATGCAPTTSATTQPAAALDPTQVYTLTVDGFTTTVTTLTGLKTDGVFSTGDWANILTGINAAQAALNAWGANLNSPTAAESAFDAALPGLLKYVALGIKAKSATPTTKASQ